MSFGALAVTFVVAGATAYSAYSSSDAQGKAIDSQKKAIKRLKEINIPDYIDKARLGDKEQFIARYEDLRDADPTLGAVRTGAEQQMRDIIEGKNNPAQSLLDDLVSEGKVQVDDPRYRALEDSLIQRAQTHLDEGATLPPEYQAELIRSGLEQGGTVNPATGVNRNGPLAQLLGKRIGAAELQLQAQREQQAMGLAQGATAIKGNRMAILSGLLPAAEQEREQQFNLAGRGLTAASVLGPAGGVSGKEILNLNEANRQLYNQSQLGLGKLSAQRNIKNGQENAAYAQAIASLVSSVAGGGGGGGGSILSGLFSSNSSPAQYGGGTWSPSQLQQNPAGYNSWGGATDWRGVTNLNTAPNSLYTY